MPFASESSMRFTNTSQSEPSRVQVHAQKAGYPIPEGLSEYPPPWDMVTTPGALASESSRPVTPIPAISAAIFYPSVNESRQETPATYTPQFAVRRSSDQGRHTERVYDPRQRTATPYISRTIQRPTLTAKQSRPESIHRSLRQELMPPFTSQRVQQPDLGNERDAASFRELPRPNTMSNYTFQDRQQPVFYAERRKSGTVPEVNQQMTAIYAASEVNNSSNQYYSRRPGSAPPIMVQPHMASPRIHPQAPSHSSHSTSKRRNSTAYGALYPGNSNINIGVRREGVPLRPPSYSDVVVSHMEQHNASSFSSPGTSKASNINSISQSTCHSNPGVSAAALPANKTPYRSSHLPQWEDTTAPSVQGFEFSNQNTPISVRRTNAPPHRSPRFVQLDGAATTAPASEANGYSNSTFPNATFQRTKMPSYLGYLMSHNEGLATQGSSPQTSQSKHTERNRGGSEALTQTSNTTSLSTNQTWGGNAIAQAAKETGNPGQKANECQFGLNETASKSATASEASLPPSTTTPSTSVNTSSHAMIGLSHLTRSGSITSHASQNLPYSGQVAGNHREKNYHAPDTTTSYSSHLLQLNDPRAPSSQKNENMDSNGPRQWASQNAPKADDQATTVPSHASQRQGTTVPVFQKIDNSKQNTQGHDASSNRNGQSFVAQPTTAFSSAPPEDTASFNNPWVQTYTTTTDMPGQNVWQSGLEHVPSPTRLPKQKRQSTGASQLESSTVSHPYPQTAVPAEMHIPQGTAFKRNRTASHNTEDVRESESLTSQRRQALAKPLIPSVDAFSVNPSQTPRRVGRPSETEMPPDTANKQHKRPHTENGLPRTSFEQDRRTPQVVVSQTRPSQDRSTKRRRIESAKGPCSADVMVVIPSRRVIAGEPSSGSKRDTGCETPGTEQLVQVVVPSTPSRFEKPPGATAPKTHSEQKRHYVEPKEAEKQSFVEIAVARTGSRSENDANAFKLKNSRPPPDITQHSTPHRKDDRQSLDQNAPRLAQENPLQRPSGHVEYTRQDNQMPIEAPRMSPPYPAHLFRPSPEAIPQQPAPYPNHSSWTGQSIPAQPLCPYVQQHLPGSIPQSTNPPVSTALASVRPGPPQLDAIIPKNSFTLNDPNVRNYLKNRPHIVKPINPGDAAKRTHYNPATIARDVLIASGRHPTEPLLNDHLLRLRDVFAFVKLNSDLATFRWDWVDPVPMMAENTTRGKQLSG